MAQASGLVNDSRFTDEATRSYPWTMLLLKKHLIDLVRSGKKRQTIRLWDRPHVRVGQISYTPGLGKLKITRIDELPTLSALSTTDAVADGFATLPDLLAEIHRSYPVIPPGKRLFRISFQWPLLPEATGTAPLQTKPVTLRKAKNDSGTPVAVTSKYVTSIAQREALKGWVLAVIGT